MRSHNLALFVLMLVFFVLGLSGCAQAQPATTTSVALIRSQGDFFSAAGDCAYCHTGLTDQSGADVSIDTDWRSSMMANSTRDPYYRASIRSEILAYPQYSEVIQDKCTVCHVGMAYQTAKAKSEPILLFSEDGFMDSDHPLHDLAIDGVSCTLCHQITAKGLGEPESFSGGYEIDLETASGKRALYGIFAVDSGMSTLMSGASGFVPTQSEHVQQSEACAVCHNLFTPYITNTGELSQEIFPEQTPQLEYLHSAYTESQSCQSCHMPAANGATAIANSGSPQREPFAQHILAGGNQYMVNLLANNAAELEVTADSEQFSATAEKITQQLSERTAVLTLSGAQDGNQINVDAGVQILTGHKFPTSFPSRRAWLHLTVLDAKGKLVFESGQWNADGAISGNANDADASQFEPHYEVIQSADQVQIYESIIGDPDGLVTTTLLRASHYLKDNRLLPLGFDKASASADIAVIGAAEQDASFIAGGDTTRYQIDVSGLNGPFSVQAELVYQTIGYRWGEKFRAEENPEGSEFYRYTSNTPNTPVIISSASLQLP